MKYRQTLVGFLVLGLVGAGVYWVRSRPSMPASMRPAASVGAQAGQRLFDDTLPDVTVADASVDAGDVRITLSLTSRPPVAYVKTRVRVSAETGGAPVTLDGGVIWFEMTMPMGDHGSSLVPGAQGWQEAEVILPLCMSGKRRWYATVEGTAAGQPRMARFRLDLTPPPATP